MLQTIKIKELMTRDLVTIGPMDLMNKVKEIFDTHSFHHIPVTNEDGSLAGIISKHDYNIILSTFSIFKSSRADLDNRKVMGSMVAKDVMTKQVAKLMPEDTLSVAVELFKENLFHALPVVDQEGKVVGILSTYDLLNFAFDEKKMIKSA